MRKLLPVLAFVILVGTSKAKNCNSHSDCRPHECCVTKTYMHGGCRTRGIQGSPCQPEPAKSHLGDMYINYCPCVDYLRCVPESMEDDGGIQIYHNSTCQSVGD